MEEPKKLNRPLEDISQEYFDMLFTRAISIMAGSNLTLNKGVRYKRCFFDDLVDLGMIKKGYRDIVVGSKIANVPRFKEELFKVISHTHSNLSFRVRSGLIQLFTVAYKCYLQDESLKKLKEKKDGKEISKDTDSK